MIICYSLQMRQWKKKKKMGVIIVRSITKKRSIKMATYCYQHQHQNINKTKRIEFKMLN